MSFATPNAWEYATLFNLPHDISLWTSHDRIAYSKWQKTKLTYSGGGESTGFGPGVYEEGYTGEGDRIYWPPTKPGEGVELTPMGKDVGIDPSIYSGDEAAISEIADAEAYGRGRIAPEMQYRAISEVSSESMMSGTTGTMGDPDFYRGSTLGSEMETRGYIKPFGTTGGEVELGPMGETADLLASTMSMSSGGRSAPPSWSRETAVSDLATLDSVPTIPDGIFTKMTPAQLATVETSLNDSLVGVTSEGDGIFTASSVLSTIASLVGGAALNAWLNSLGETGKNIVNMLNISGVVLAILDANPIGIAAGGIGFLAQTFMEQDMWKKANNWGEDVSDSKFGYVEDGGIFYPAVLRLRTHGEGLLDTSNQVELVYGRSEDFYLAKDATGKIRAHFRNAKTRQFRMTDEEYDSTGYDKASKADPLRQYYFLGAKDTQEMLKKYGTKDFAFKEYKRDTSDYTPYMKDNADFVSALDFIKARTDKSGDVTTNLFPASKAFRYAFNGQTDSAAHYGDDVDIRDGTRGARPTASDAYGIETWWDSDNQWWRPGKTGLAEWTDVVKEYLPREMEALTRTRKNAAEELGVDEGFYVDWWKDMPPATSSDELRKQYELIDAMSDRTVTQREYLQSKVATRYMLQKMGKMGYAKPFYDSLHDAEKDNIYEGDSIPPWVNKGESAVAKWMTLDTERREKEDAVASKFGDNMAAYVKDNYDVNEYLRGMGVERMKSSAQKKKEHEDLKKEVTPTKDELVKKEREMSGIKGAIEDTGLVDIKEEHLGTGPDVDIRGEEVSLEKVKAWLDDPDTDPAKELGLSHYGDFLHNYVTGFYNWSGSDPTVTGEMLPPKEDIDQYKSLLRAANNDATSRGRLSALYDFVEKPETTEYLKRFHTADKSKIEFARDAAGTTELYADWSLPYQHRTNEVKFQHHIAKQMNFGYDAGEQV